MKTQESMENYLETIYVLNQKTGFVRSVDVAVGNGLQQAQHFQCHEKAEGGGLCADRG